MRQIYLLCIFLIASFSGFTQEPVKAIGIRGGISSGFEYRVFSGEMNSYKVLLSFRQQGLQLTGLKGIHQSDVFDFCEELSFVYGFGAHAGFESWHRQSYYDDRNLYTTADGNRTGPVVGLDALAAVEYAIPRVPLVAGIEAKPYFNLFGKNFFQLHPFDIAFTLKYTF